MRFERVPPHKLSAIIGRDITFPVVAYVGIEDDRILGVGTLEWIEERCWLAFAGFDVEPAHAVHVVRRARFLLQTARQLGDKEVFSLRDPSHPSSTKLLETIGFQMTGMLMDDTGEIEVWSNG